MRTDLSQATFIIPIRIESPDRLRNVITTTAFLLENFDTNIIIQEVDKHSVFEKEALPILEDIVEVDIWENFNFIHKKSDEPLFHRQRVLNEMIMECETDIVVNYDCDVILPKESYTLAYKGIMDDIYDVVYPYGQGMFQKQVAATDVTVSKFLETGDYEFLNAVSKDHTSDFGWAQFFKTSVYKEGGMENENFKAWGPEDEEKHYRFPKLGYNIGRIFDWVYHLEHSRGDDSERTNIYFHDNLKLMEDIRSLSVEELRNYYNTQEYLKKYHD